MKKRIEQSLIIPTETELRASFPHKTGCNRGDLIRVERKLDQMGLYFDPRFSIRVFRTFLTCGGCDQRMEFKNKE